MVGCGPLLQSPRKRWSRPAAVGNLMDARPHCILHIGCPKTGTTSLQQFLTLNREFLLSQGVLYPRSLLERPEELLHTALAS